MQEPLGLNAPIYQALAKRRFDLVQLLVEHGFDASQIEMEAVFESWDSQIMNYFIERGADLIRDQPLAHAFCSRIRTALGVYKQYRQKVPELQLQADIALRHHCWEGNLKWVSLMLWAGADPFALGGCEPNEQPGDDDDEGLSALSWAALGGHYDVFQLKPIRDALPGPRGSELLRHLTHGRGIDIMEKLLESGVDPNDQDNGGSSIIRHMLSHMGWQRTRFSWGIQPWQRKHDGKVLADTEETRSQIRGIHLLVKHGANWRPSDKREIGEARRNLLNLTADYTIEFVWIMCKYQASSLESIQELLRTPSIKAHTSAQRQRLNQILGNWAVVGQE